MKRFAAIQPVGPLVSHLSTKHDVFESRRSLASSLSPTLRTAGVRKKSVCVPVCQASVANVSPTNSDAFIEPKPRHRTNILETVVQWVAKAVTVVGVAIALSLLNPMSSEAARSGGRAGGSSFRSRSTIARTRPSAASSSTAMSSSPTVGFGLNSFFFPSFGMGYGWGYGFGGGGLINIIIYGFMFAVFIQVLQGLFGGNDYDDEGYGYDDERVSVARVQVGLLGTARDLQKDLDRVASSADTSSPQGLHYILQETVLALNRNPDYCVYGAGQVKSTSNPEAAEQKFNELSLKERSKIQQETLSNVGGQSMQSELRAPAAEGQNEYIVVTILVAMEGEMKLPKVTNREELSTALNRLGGVGSDQVMAVEVLWVPQDGKDSYTQEELLQEYPNLYNL